MAQKSQVMPQSGNITTLYGAAYGPLEWKNNLD